MTVRIGITGAAGRMGRMLASAISESGDACQLVAAIERPESSLLGADMGELMGGDPSGTLITADLAAVADQIDVLIDFTVPEATLHNAGICASNELPMVVGTTGFTEDQADALAATVASVPFCQSSNFAPGVNLTFRLVEAAAKALADTVDIEIIETHHRHKIDAPSGTALSLGDAVASALGQDATALAVHGREGRTGARDRKSIGFHAVRGGDVVGDHTVIFAGDGERLEITHRASSRMAFAQGAVRAACWLVQQPPGRYSMQDVLAEQEIES